MPADAGNTDPLDIQRVLDLNQRPPVGQKRERQRKTLGQHARDLTAGVQQEDAKAAVPREELRPNEAVGSHGHISDHLWSRMETVLLDRLANIVITRSEVFPGLEQRFRFRTR